MDTTKLKRVAPFARRTLQKQVEAKLAIVLAEDSLARRESLKAVQALQGAILLEGKEHLIERVAYTWFNRFCALRFMDLQGYNQVKVLSPADPSKFQPEILADAKNGIIDSEIVSLEPRRARIFGLLDGTIKSHAAQDEAYSLLLVSACNYWSKSMPFLFQHISDYTELLLPDGLLAGDSVPAMIREAMIPLTCESVEVLGWLYQFYVSEKKEQVFTDLKKNKKITPENIPAATQLFTPDWIVRYLVENSLGRLWMLNRPTSMLAESMEYYIKPEEVETDFLRINSPEDIKICDPACGSGHMLTYAFDLLYAIYEEEGYSASEIPTKILTHNLYGVELDERAGGLASFALTMKAREKDRRFFRRPVKPNICVLKNVTFKAGELNAYRDEIGHEHFSTSIIATLHDFEEADNFGSLIRPTCTDVDAIQKLIDTLDAHPSAYALQFRTTYLNVVKALQQAIYLAPRYHTLIANPPYMGGKGMNARLGAWAKTNYKDSKSDLFAMFIERCLELSVKQGLAAMITMQSWMFLSSFEELRKNIIANKYITTLIQIGYNSFPELNSKVAQASAFVLKNEKSTIAGSYINLNDAPQSADKNIVFLEKKFSNQIFIVSQFNFTKIPGSPVAYWVSERVREIFVESSSLAEVANVACGMTTGDNALFVRDWFEVAKNKIGWGIKGAENCSDSGKKWFPYNKGGDFRKWFGNNNHLVNWQNNGFDIIENGRAFPRAKQYYFQESITWTFISSSKFGVRASDAGFIFDMSGCSAFPIRNMLKNKVTAFLCTNIAFEYLKAMNPTLNFQVGNVASLPWLGDRLTAHYDLIERVSQKAISLSRSDWDAYETSWDFTSLPLLRPEFRKENLAETYASLREHWQSMTNEMQELEEENNRIFIDAYGLQDELIPDVPLKEITLTCNPHYRYGGEKTAEELDVLLLADTMRELVSYAVGCMFGRYSLDKEGLVLANAGEGIAEYTAQVPSARFLADEDNVIPILDGNWFSDDIVERFQNFLKVTFGAENYRENLNFVENSLNVKGKRDYSIRDYFLNEFYNDHVKRYKKRPIYWLFTSPRGTFNALIYMHRYSQDTASIVLNRYLRDFISKLENRVNQLNQSSTNIDLSNRDRAVIDKELQKVRKDLAELKKYESEVLYPLATQQVTIDLDDGVKVNYPKLGNALKKIVGLADKDAKEE